MDTGTKPLLWRAMRNIAGAIVIAIYFLAMIAFFGLLFEWIGV